MLAWIAARALAGTLLLTLASAEAADRLPYTRRTRPYSAGSTTVRGDIRTVGMAGATTGLADTFIAAVDNPAGLALTVADGDDTLAKNHVHDGFTQNYDEEMSSLFAGVALAPYPWGFGLGYVALSREGAPYLLAPTSATAVPLAITTREIQLALSRVFFDNRLSLGATARFGQTEENIDLGEGNNYTAAYHAYALGGTFGAMFQLNGRWLIGLSHSMAMRYNVDGAAEATTALPGFFQPVYVPTRTSIGLGWIPNRFLRASVSFTRIGSTPDTSLLKDEAIAIGVTPTYQPRLGAALVLLDYKELRGTFFAGPYYEVTRAATQSNRLHFTAGVETKPWIFTVGAGIDTASEYNNLLVSLSVDIFKVMMKLDLIPRRWRPPYAGLVTNPLLDSDEGLARPLVRNWRRNGPDLDPIGIATDIPNRLGKKVGEATDQINSLIGAPPSEHDVPPAKPQPAPAPRKKKRKSSGRVRRDTRRPRPVPDDDD